jgi:ureidoacrylate peracid hydrolase
MKLRMKPTPGRTALVVVDMQNAFCEDEGSCNKRGINITMLKATVGPCVRLVEAARRHGIPVIFTRYMYRADYLDGGVMIRYLSPRIEGMDHLVAGTWDVEIVDALKPLPGDAIIDKNRASAFYATNLQPILNGLNADTLFVCGVTTNCCVETTVRDAAQRDYKTFVVSDATAERAQHRHDNALESMAALFADVVTTDETTEMFAQLS